ncbi:MAG: deoxynucleoside kinase [Flavobacteriales bacterium]|nr:deoxynucleoside kinase [Flavobacteriales bacterium]
MAQPDRIPYRHIVVEGGIGAGKSTLAKALADALGVSPVLEPFADNPFLEQFYSDPDRYAFPVELSFLAQRYKQLKAAITARNLFRDALVADYVFAKSDLFAKITLPKAEYALFRNLYDVMADGMPKPELIVYLRPGEARQHAQIAARGRAYEQDIDKDYLRRIEKAYERQFKHARGSRVLWVDTSEVDFAGRSEDLQRMVDLISQPWGVGVHEVTP